MNSENQTEQFEGTVFSSDGASVSQDSHAENTPARAVRVIESDPVVPTSFESVAQPWAQAYEGATISAQSLYHIAEESFRRHFELGLHFLQDLALAQTPAESLKLQLDFFSAQFELLAEQSREAQSQAAKLFLTPFEASTFHPSHQ